MSKEKQNTDDPSPLFVRLKPYDKKKGWLTRQYRYWDKISKRFLVFKIPMRWYKVPRRIGEDLRLKRQQTHVLHSQPVFDVCEEHEAKQLDAMQAAELERKKEAENPTIDKAFDMTVEDENGGSGDIVSEDILKARKEALARLGV